MSSELALARFAPPPPAAEVLGGPHRWRHQTDASHKKPRRIRGGRGRAGVARRPFWRPRCAPAPVAAGRPVRRCPGAPRGRRAPGGQLFGEEVMEGVDLFDGFFLVEGDAKPEDAKSRVGRHLQGALVAGDLSGAPWLVDGGVDVAWGGLGSIAATPGYGGQHLMAHPWAKKAAAERHDGQRSCLRFELGQKSFTFLWRRETVL